MQSRDGKRSGLRKDSVFGTKIRAMTVAARNLKPMGAILPYNSTKGESKLMAKGMDRKKETKKPKKKKA
jgi:hypothetical protein